MMRTRFAVMLLAECAGATLSAQRRAFDMDVPRPIAAADKVWIEELTWMEIRDAIRAGKTTALKVLEDLGYEIATPNEAREMLALKGADQVAF